MPSNAVVEQLNVFKHTGVGLIKGLEMLCVDRLHLEPGKEGLDHGIAPRGQAPRSQQLPDLA